MRLVKIMMYGFHWIILDSLLFFSEIRLSFKTGRHCNVKEPGRFDTETIWIHNISADTPCAWSCSVLAFETRPVLRIIVIYGAHWAVDKVRLLFFFFIVCIREIKACKSLTLSLSLSRFHLWAFNTQCLS